MPIQIFGRRLMRINKRECVWSHDECRRKSAVANCVACSAMMRTGAKQANRIVQSNGQLFACPIFGVEAMAEIDTHTHTHKHTVCSVHTLTAAEEYAGRYRWTREEDILDACG